MRIFSGKVTYPILNWKSGISGADKIVWIQFAFKDYGYETLELTAVNALELGAKLTRLGKSLSAQIDARV
jgi:hypothetical protein